MIKKTLVAILTSVGAISLIGLLLYFVFPSPFPWGYVENERRASPDGRFDAVVLRGSAGAMSGFQFEIYVVVHGTIVERERDRRHCIYKSYENSGSFTYLWKDSDLYVTVEETPIQHFWPYYFVEDEVGKRERVGHVFLEFKRKPIEKRGANQPLVPTATSVTPAANAPVAPAAAAAHL